ncbi:MAG: hypothetical protein GTN40_03430 [Candidatus Aenigmarchaeota archaeon]|nr:hypothetical protein [Candidatus Aenigmarchaeota archaeon]
MDLDFGIHNNLSNETEELARRLKTGFLEVMPVFVRHLPDGYKEKELWEKMRCRTYKFSPEEKHNEFYKWERGFNYICLNSLLLQKDFYNAFEHLCHSLVHSFSFFTPSSLELGDVMEETNCEVVGYRALRFLLRNDGEQEAIVERTKRRSPKRYTEALEIGESLEKRESNILKNLNSLMLKLERNNLVSNLERLFRKENKIRAKTEEKVSKSFLKACKEAGITKEELMNLDGEFKKNSPYLIEEDFLKI